MSRQSIYKFAYINLCIVTEHSIGQLYKCPADAWSVQDRFHSVVPGIFLPNLHTNKTVEECASAVM